MGIQVNMTIHTPTKEDFINVVELLFNKGKEWNGGGKYTSSHLWNKYKSNTYICIGDCKYFTYCNIWYVTVNELPSISARQFCSHNNNLILKKKYDLK